MARRTMRAIQRPPSVGCNDSLPFLARCTRRNAIRQRERGRRDLQDRRRSRGLSAGDPYFLPVYELAADLGLAVCIHQAGGWTPISGQLSAFARGDAETFPVLAAFSSLLNAKISERLPRLKVGFIEASAGWLPHLLGRAGWTWSGDWTARSKKLSDLNFYVTCETYEDVPYLLDVAGGDDNFIVGSDYTHGDRASVLDAHPKIRGRSDIDEKSAVKITDDNARAFYGL